MALRPLMMMRTRGLRGPFFCKFANLTSYTAHSVGNFISAGGSEQPELKDYEFVAAYHGETDEQNIQIEGNVMNIMPKGVITATSIHSTPIMATDKDGIYIEYPVDAPVWKWVSVDGDGTEQFTGFTSINSPWVNNGDGSYSIDGTQGSGADLSGLNPWPINGEDYVHKFTVTSLSGGSAIAYLLQGSSVPITLGVNKHILLSDSPNYVFRALAGTVMTIKDISIQKQAITKPGSDVYAQANKAATNSMLNSNEGTGGAWIQRGASVVTFDEDGLLGANSATKVLNIELGSNDLYQTISGLTVSGLVSVRVWLKALTTNRGLLGVASPVSAEGNWTVDMALISTTEFELITNTHPAVTVNSEFKNDGAGNGGIQFKYAGSTFVDFIFANTEYADTGVSLTSTTEPPIITTTAAASIPALDYIYPAANIDPSDVKFGLKIDYEGDDVVVMDIGGVSLLSITAGVLKLSDGTNQLTQAINVSSHIVYVTLSATSMELDVDGTKQLSDYVPIAAGLITVSEDHYALHANPLL